MSFERSEEYKKSLLIICVLFWGMILFVLVLGVWSRQNFSKARFVLSCIEREASRSPNEVSSECKEAVTIYRREVQQYPKLNQPSWLRFDCYGGPLDLDPQCDRIYIMGGQEHTEYFKFSGLTLVSVTRDES